MKKIIALILSCITFTTLFVPSFADASNPVNAEPIISEEEKELLGVLGIIGGYDESFTDDMEVKRSEFSVIISRLLGAEINADKSSINGRFSDVDDSYWAAPEILFATNGQYISGYDDGKFYPEETVKYQDVLNALIKVMGYDKIATVSGDTTFEMTAEEIGLTDGVRDDKYVKRADLFKLIHNAIGIDIYVPQIDASANGIVYEAYEDYTILNKYRDIDSVEGIISATEATSLTSYVAGTAPKGNVIINNKVFNVGETSAEQMIGMKVEAYYQTDEKEVKTLIYTDYSENDVIMVNGADIAADNIPITLENYTYENEKGKLIKQKMDNADVIYNGAARPDYKKTDIIPTDGYVVLIDNDNDGQYEVLKVFDPTSCVVIDKISENDESFRIVDAIEKGKIITVPKENSFISVSKNDNLIDSLKDLNAGDLVLIAENKDAKTYNVEASSNYAEGNVRMRSTSELKINSVVYPVAVGVSTSQCKIGQRITVFLDKFGYVRAFTTEKVGFEYGMVFKSYGNEDLGWFLKIMNQKSEILRYALKEDVKINGTKKPAEDCIKALKEYTKSKDLARDSWYNKFPEMQLISFRLDSEGAISEINTVSKNSSGEYAKDTDLYFTNRVTRASGKYNWYDYAIQANKKKMSIDGRYYATSDTLFFIMTDVEKECYVLEGALVATDEMYLYNINEAGVAPVIVVYTDPSSRKNTVDSNSPMMVVTDVYESFDENNNLVTVLSGKIKGDKTELKYNIDDVPENIKGIVSSVEKGDVITYRQNAKSGNIEGFAKVYDYDKKSQFGVGEMATTDVREVHGLSEFIMQQYSRRVIYAKILKYIDGYVLYDIGDGITRSWYIGGYTGKVTKVSRTSRNRVNVEDASLDDLIPETRAIIVSGSSSDQDVIIMND